MEISLKNILDKIQKEEFSLYDLIESSDLCINDIVRGIEATNFFKIIKSSEGKVSTVEDKNDIKDWGKNNNSFPFHLDGGYYFKVPKYVILYCAQPSELGGNTFFSSAKEVIQKIESKYDSNFLNSLNVIYLSPDKREYKKKLIEEVDGGKQLNWFSSLYLYPDKNIISDSNRRILVKHLKEFLYDIDIYLKESIILNHQWRKNNLIIFDNQLLLHGRDEIPSQSNRRLYRIWFDKLNFLEIEKPGKVEYVCD